MSAGLSPLFRAGAAVGYALALTSVAGCLHLDPPFNCTVDEQCTTNGSVGVCEASRFCAFRDASCPSGRRYGTFAGAGLGDRCVGAGDYPKVILADGPVAYWRLGELNGTVAADEMGAEDGTYENGPLLGQAGALPDDPSTCPSFDGVDDYVALPNPNLTGSFTLEAWVYRTGPGSTGATNYSTILGWDETHRLLWQGSGGPLLVQFDGNFFSTAAVSDNAWHHVVYVFDRTEQLERFFVDGAAAGSHATNLPSWVQPFRLAAYDLTAYMFAGRIDEVAVYAKALTATQIELHYRARPTAVVP